jgi:hypothetical protein
MQMQPGSCSVATRDVVLLFPKQGVPEPHRVAYDVLQCSTPLRAHSRVHLLEVVVLGLFKRFSKALYLGLDFQAPWHNIQGREPLQNSEPCETELNCAGMYSTHGPMCNQLNVLHLHQAGSPLSVITAACIVLHATAFAANRISVIMLQRASNSFFCITAGPAFG